MTPTPTLNPPKTLAHFKTLAENRRELSRYIFRRTLSQELSFHNEGDLAHLSAQEKVVSKKVLSTLGFRQSICAAGDSLTELTEKKSIIDGKKNQSETRVLDCLNFPSMD